MKLDTGAANRGRTVNTADHRTSRVVVFNADGGADAESANGQVERAAVLSTQRAPCSVRISHNTEKMDIRAI